MSNIEIKKEIQKAVKHIDNYRIELIIWTGDGTYHKEIPENEDVIYGCIEVYNHDDSFGDEIYTGSFGSDETMTTKDIETLRQEQKKMYNYLKKHFKNITIDERTV